MNNKRQTASPSFQSPRAGSGFTMVELLVVMFVIAMLLTIGVPAALRFKTLSKINACQVTVNIIDRAVDMYQKEHKRYPALQDMAARLIGQSFKTIGNTLTEVDDGLPGPGYRLQPRGRIYGPWNGVDKLPRDGDYEENTTAARVHFVDAFGAAIWYCPFDNENMTYTDNKFDKDDSETGITITSIADYAKNALGASGRFYRRDYIIMSQSANGKWGLIRGTGGSGSSSSSAAPPTDDVTNFGK